MTGDPTFNVAANAYDSFMGRYSRLLSAQMADLAGVKAGQRVIDVGCGPGALTVELVRRVGAGSVAAVDPSPPFVAAARERFPGVDVRQAPAEELPFDDNSFDAAIAQLVVHFMSDPAKGTREMRRVTRPGGAVAACVWDHAGGQTPLGPLWAAASELDPDVVTEGHLAGARQGHLVEIFEAAGIRNLTETTLPVRVEHASFDEWWEPFTFGVGPAGAYVTSLDEDARERLRHRIKARYPAGPFVIAARAWAVRGVA